MTALLLLLSAAWSAPTVEAWIDTRASAPTLVVQVRAPDGEAWTLDVPKTQGLTLGDADTTSERLNGPQGPERVETRRYPLTGKGSFIVEKVCAKGDGEPACASPLYVDLGAPRDRSAMADIVEPGRLFPVEPVLVALGALAALGLVALAVRAARRRPREAPVVVLPPEDPHLAALRRWDAVRADPSLDDHAKALALSEIFRDYAEAVLSFPARALSTTETVRHLEQMSFLPRENIPRARRLLRATDRVKYAEATPGADFFEELDGDLRAFIESTRPKSWGSS